MIAAGSAIAQMLATVGVRTVFGIHGAHVEPLFQGCRQAGISIVDVRHEVAGGYAAEAVARTGHGLGVAIATAGPGFTNLLTSVVNAQVDRTPVLYLVGSAALSEAETHALQSGVDQVALARPAAKWAHRVTAADQLARLVPLAIRTALAEPAGAVVLDVPVDVLTAMVLPPSFPDCLPPPPAEVRPDDQAVLRAADLLSNARRPVLLVGEGAWRDRADEDVRALAERLGAPVFTDYQALGSIPASHPLAGGTYHKLAYLDPAPDVVLALGMRFGMHTLGPEGLVPADAKVIHVDVDARELGRTRVPAVAMVASSRAAARAVSAHLAATTSIEDGWADRVAAIGKARRAELHDQSQMDRSDGAIHPYAIVSRLIEHIGGRDIFIGDGAETTCWLHEALRQERSGSYLTHGFLGCMGIGLGLTIGAQAANPGRRVICVTGDGSVGFTLAEFDTLFRHKLPAIVVVLNNRSWGASQHFQMSASGADAIIGTRLENGSYAAAAAAFGCHAEQVHAIGEFLPALERSLGSGLPACIDVRVALDPMPPEFQLMASTAAGPKAQGSASARMRGAYSAPD